MSNDATFDRHIQVITANATRLSGWALRVFDSRDITTMLTIYRSLIRHALEYCSPLWFPTDQANIASIEKVQRYFTRRIDGMQGLNYWQRLKKLNLFSLERRRERYVVIYIWKSWHNIVPDIGLTVQSFDPQQGLFLHLPVLPKGKGQSHIRKLKERSIFYQGVRLFNSLPKHLRMASTLDPSGKETATPTSHIPSTTTEDLTAQEVPSIDKYKSALDEYILSLPDQPTRPKLVRSAASNSIIDQKTYRKHTSDANTKPKHNPRKRPALSQTSTAAPKRPWKLRWDKSDQS